jgi:hypothetical protein
VGLTSSGGYNAQCNHCLDGPAQGKNGQGQPFNSGTLRLRFCRPSHWHGNVLGSVNHRIPMKHMPGNRPQAWGKCDEQDEKHCKQNESPSHFDWNKEERSREPGRFHRQSIFQEWV